MPEREVIRCDRCRRRNRSPNADNGWNVTVKQGVIVGFLCPACQTPEENAEAFINEATTDYATDAFGRLVGSPRTGGTA